MFIMGKFFFLLIIFGCFSYFGRASSIWNNASSSDLTFNSLAQRWDEAIPLGNGVVGALIWEKGGNLRFALDRTDLWDLRPMHYFDDPTYTFEWVKQHIRNHNYQPVQDHFDIPYDNVVAPSKIPGAALEFPMKVLGKVKYVHLFLKTAVCKVDWMNGSSLQTFVSAHEPIGWFVFNHVPSNFTPEIIMPRYESADVKASTAFSGGQDVALLGYPQGILGKKGTTITYHQLGYNGFSYDVAVSWKRVKNSIYGVWSITSTHSSLNAESNVHAALSRGFIHDLNAHLAYWKKYWNASSVTIPDVELQKEYDNDMYKFGSVARSHAYPISLQAVWTADDGHLPPWKGDYHHDLNTQLSYWPAYEGNHVSESMGFVNTLWDQQDVYKKYTKQYFGKEGLNVPGVCSLTGEPLGGWIQYAMSQTTGAWLAQYFYLHWKYTADDVFLKTRAYPFVKEIARFLEQQTSLNNVGKRTLEFSSSPELNRNTLQAWFSGFTNNDLALTRFAFHIASEMAHHLSLWDEERHWALLESQLPDYYVDEDGALMLAERVPVVSHRHLSHAMAIFPLALIDWYDDQKSKMIIRSTLDKLWDVGVEEWWGFSYVWMANLEAMAQNGENAYKALKTFVHHYVSQNTFCLNGNQGSKDAGQFRGRTFSLEGNFAFASGIQKMLLQSHRGIAYVFPAIPHKWRDVSFNNLRLPGAFLVSATMRNGRIIKLKVFSEKGGDFSIVSPSTKQVLHYKMKVGESISIC